MGQRRHVNVGGPLAPYAAGFEIELGRQGYRSGRGLLGLMARLSRWLGAHELDACDLSRSRVEQFLADSGEGVGAGALSMRAMVPLLNYLVGIGVAPVREPVSASTALEVLMERYALYLIEERGLGASSVRHYVAVACGFLSWSGSGGELGLESLSTATVTGFVLAECGRGKVGSAKAMTTRLRSLLRFLYVQGFTPTSLAGAVPVVASWRLSGLPETLSASQVDRLLESCDRRTTDGRRDFAIITVVARLGLRAGEVAGLQLGDIDWRHGELTVRGKGNRQDRLPLPTDVGQAIADWLERGRPRCECRSVFIRVSAPRRELTGGGVSAIVRRACQRAGLVPVGAHRLRHTAASGMLQGGASLAEVGQVLRHQSHNTTSIYAKVDRRALIAVVAPWPGSTT